MALLNMPLSSTLRRPSNTILLAAITSVVLVFLLLRFREPGIVLRAAHISRASSFASLDSINNATLGVSYTSMPPLLLS
jgi:hypothetical protein